MPNDTKSSGSADPSPSADPMSAAAARSSDELQGAAEDAAADGSEADGGASGSGAQSPHSPTSPTPQRPAGAKPSKASEGGRGRKLEVAADAATTNGAHSADKATGVLPMAQR